LVIPTFPSHPRKPRLAILSALNRTALNRVHKQIRKDDFAMNINTKLKEAGAAGYILLWLLGIPIPVLFLIFLLRGCT
jgi:hypothetical protein